MDAMVEMEDTVGGGEEEEQKIALWLSQTADSQEAAVRTATQHLESAQQTMPKFASLLLRLSAGKLLPLPLISIRSIDRCTLPCTSSSALPGIRPFCCHILPSHEREREREREIDWLICCHGLLLPSSRDNVLDSAPWMINPSTLDSGERRFFRTQHGPLNLSAWCCSTMHGPCYEQFYTFVKSFSFSPHHISSWIRFCTISWSFPAISTHQPMWLCDLRKKILPFSLVMILFFFLCKWEFKPQLWIFELLSCVLLFPYFFLQEVKRKGRELHQLHIWRIF